MAGQVPPPFVGQAIAIESFVGGEYERLELFHVPMTFSRRSGEVGKLRLVKVAKLPSLVIRILWARFRHGADVLYYPPAADGWVPFVRDLVVLGGCRWAFRATVFHLHAGGLAQAYSRMGGLGKAAFRLVYFHPDVAISLWGGDGTDSSLLDPGHEVVVANGVPDKAGPRLAPRPTGNVTKLLFVGLLRRSKGVLTLLEAGALLVAKDVDFELRLVGEFQPPSFEAEVRACIARSGLTERVEMPGRLIAADKWEEYSKADIFCFPSYFDNLPLAVIEAMSFELPVVGSRLPGIESLVEEGVTGNLVETGDAAALAHCIASLVGDPGLRAAMGSAARRRYLERYTLDEYRRALEEAVLLAAPAARPGVAGTGRGGRRAMASTKAGLFRR